MKTWKDIIKKQNTENAGSDEKSTAEQLSPKEQVMEHILRSGIFLLGILALFVGVRAFLNDSVLTNNTVNGRELPIYCVETDKKVVALSFDAAWENGKVRCSGTSF